MATYRDRFCPVCEGRGYIPRCETWDHGNGLGGGRAWSEPCGKCQGSGKVQVAITNSERLAELRTPEDQLRFIRGFQKYAKYSDVPRKLLNDDSDEDMLIWLNKTSEDLDDDIFSDE